MKKVSALVGSVLCASLAFGLPMAQAQEAKTVNLIIPFPPGGAVDGLARVLAEKLAEQDKYRAVIVDNRPGAGGQIAVNALKNAPKDGTAFYLGHGATYTLNRFVYDDLSYNPDEDLEPVSIVATAPVFLIVPGDSPDQTLEDFLERAKTEPMDFGSPGVGTETHLAGEVLKVQADIDGEHVPYKGAGPALIDLATGRIDYMFDVLIGSNAYLQDGRLRVLASAGSERSDFQPDAPTFAEGGVEGIDFDLFFAAAAPGGTPKEVVDELSADIRKAMVQDDVIEQFAKLGMVIQASTPEEMQERVDNDVASFTEILKNPEIKVK